MAQERGGSNAKMWRSIFCHLSSRKISYIHCHYRLSNLAQIFVVKLEAWPQMITNI